jgi:hypothetical protein
MLSRRRWPTRRLSRRACAKCPCTELTRGEADACALWTAVRRG